MTHYSVTTVLQYGHTSSRSVNIQSSWLRFSTTEGANSSALYVSGLFRDFIETLEGRDVWM